MTTSFLRDPLSPLRAVGSMGPPPRTAPRRRYPVVRRVTGARVICARGRACKTDPAVRRTTDLADRRTRLGPAAVPETLRRVRLFGHDCRRARSLAVASADVRRSRRRFSTRRVSRFHSSPRPGRASPSRSGRRLLPWRGQKSLWRGQKCRAGYQKSPAVAGNTEPGGWPSRRAIPLWQAVWGFSAAGNSAVRVMPRERAVIPCRCSGALRWVLFRLRSCASPIGVLLSRRLGPRLARVSRRASCLAVPVLVGGLLVSGVASVHLEAVTGASVEAQRGVSEMIGWQSQAARLRARVAAPVVDWTAGAGAGAAGGVGGLRARGPGGPGVAPLRDAAYPAGWIGMVGAPRGCGVASWRWP
jgi:hypothetical protein